VTDVVFLCAAMSLFLFGLVLLGVVADAWERREARRRNPRRRW
jgi:hypothetical protein